MLQYTFTTPSLLSLYFALQPVTKGTKIKGIFTRGGKYIVLNEITVNEIERISFADKPIFPGA